MHAHKHQHTHLKVKVVCSAEVPAQELFRPDVEHTHHHELMDDLGIVKVGGMKDGCGVCMRSCKHVLPSIVHILAIVHVHI